MRLSKVSTAAAPSWAAGLVASALGSAPSSAVGQRCWAAAMRSSSSAVVRQEIAWLGAGRPSTLGTDLAV